MSKKGYKQTEEHKKKIGLSNSVSLRGHKQSKESNEKRSISAKKSGVGKWNIGRCGKEAPHWQGGKTSINEKIRKSTEYKLWRESVFIRDNYTCIWCGGYNKRLNADHIKPFAFYPELRFAINNGRTLCEDCHRKTNTYGEKAKKYKNGFIVE